MKSIIRPVGRRIPLGIRQGMQDLYRRLTSVHVPDGSPNVLLFTMPRSGSTWLMELIWSQPGFKCVTEPFDMRLLKVQNALGLQSWDDLQNDANRSHIEKYMRGYLENRLHTQEVSPHLNKFYRRRTSRIVFKIIHAGENQIDWFATTFNARVVFMTRHPIPVSLSHVSHPRLASYVNSDFSRRFSADQLELARTVIASGSKLQQGVLDWCFQNASPLQDRNENWAVLTYEQLVLDPEPVLHYLARKLDLPDEGKMRQQLDQASQVRHKSDAETRQLLNERASDTKRLRLVSKWQDKVSDAEVREAFDILEVFGIDTYRQGSFLPHQDLWVGDNFDRVNNLLNHA